MDARLPESPAALHERSPALIERARSGDRDAANELFEAYRPLIVGFLHARLPAGARSFKDTQDLAQSVCKRAFDGLRSFEPRGVGAFWSYLRAIAGNHLTDLARNPRVRRPSALLEEQSSVELAASGVGPLERVASQEEFGRYERSLASLPERARRALIMRFELQADYARIATECGYPTPDAARASIKRAVTELAREMSRRGS